MFLESKRLTFQEVCWKDVPDIHRLHTYAEVDQYNTLGIPKNREETKEAIRPMLEDQKAEKENYIFGK